jgi:hypothetical protein
VYNKGCGIPRNRSHFRIKFRIPRNSKSHFRKHPSTYLMRTYWTEITIQ